MTAINTNIDRGEPLDITLAKMTIRGDSTAFEKHYFYDLLVKLADKERSPNETAEQAFSKVLTENKTGQLLYAALRAAPGVEKKEPPAAKPETAEEQANRLGPAHRELHIMATDRAKAMKLTYPRAYADVYSAPENQALRDRAKTEHRASMSSGTFDELKR